MDKYDSGNIQVCFCLDENFILPCKVLIQEIVSHTKNNITFHFIGIPPTNMNTSCECKFYEHLNTTCFTSFNLENYFHLTKAAMYRLLIPLMINSDKVLYLDIDTIVFKDITPLWNKNIDLAGAVMDTMCNCNLKVLNNINNNKLNLKKYFNSGVILFNSKKIRKEIPNYKQNLINIQKKYKLYFKDQDIFNILFNNRITPLEYEYNIHVNNLKENKENRLISNKKDMAYKDPSIVHCMGPKKWWTTKGLPFEDVWNRYLNMI